jgi:hypothetical protein
MASLAPDPPALDADDEAMPISSETFWSEAQGFAVREAVEEVVRAAVLVRPETLRLSVESANAQAPLLELFHPERISNANGLGLALIKSRRILDVLNETLDQFSTLDIATETRAGFINRLINDLCQSENLDRRTFERALTDSSFSRTRARFQRWLTGQ